MSVMGGYNSGLNEQMGAAQPRRQQVVGGGMRQPARTGLGGSVAPVTMYSSRPTVAPTQRLSVNGGPAMGNMARVIYRRAAPAFGEGNHDAMTGVSNRQRTGMPNAVEAARQQGTGLGGSLPQPKQYSNAPNIVNYTNRTYAAPQAQAAVPLPPAQPVGGTTAPMQQQQQPQAPPVAMPPQAPAALPGGPMNERDLREKEAMQ